MVYGVLVSAVFIGVQLLFIGVFIGVFFWFIFLEYFDFPGIADGKESAHNAGGPG